MRPTAVVSLFVALVWGLCFVLIKASLPSPVPLLLAGLRAISGGIFLTAWVVLAPARQPRRGRGLPSWPVLLGAALLNATLAFGAMYLAAGRTEASVASILAGGQPIVLALAGWLVFGERLTTRSAAGLAVAMAGVVLIASAGPAEAGPEGISLALAAAVAPAAGTVLMRRVGDSIDLPATVAAQFVLGGVILVALSAVTESWSGLQWPNATIASLAILGVLGTGVAYAAWFWLLGRTSFARLGGVLYLVPVVGAVAALATGERLSAVELAGLLAVLAGVVIVSMAAASPPSPTQAAAADPPG